MFIYTAECIVRALRSLSSTLSDPTPAQATVEAFGGTIDVLVSNAAVNPAGGPILAMPEAAIDKILEVNVKAAIMLTRAVVLHMPRVRPYTLSPQAPIT